MAQAPDQKKQLPTPNYPSKLKEPKVVLLWSSLSSNAHQQSAQKTIHDLFIAKKIRFEVLDGSQNENKDHRNEFFKISNQNGKYPQVFILANGKKEYVGMDEEIQYMLDSETFDEKFQDTIM
jgi:hypothetical protein